MLAIVKEQSIFFQLSASIKEDFDSIKNLEWLIADKLRILRDEELYIDGGYKTFEDYCENELSGHDGYRRAMDLLTAKKVVDVLPHSLKSAVRKPSHTRPLLRLLKTPDKLEQAVELATQNNPEPTATDFARAAEEVAPRSTNNHTKKHEKNKTQLRILVRVSSQSAIRPGEEGEMRDGPTPDLKFVAFPDGIEELFRVEDLMAAGTHSSGIRSHLLTFTESELNDRISQAIESALIGRKVELEEAALQAVKEQLEAARSHSALLREKNTQLQLEVDRLSALQQLESENERLTQETEELKNALSRSAIEQWDKHVFNNEAAKVLNHKVVAVLEKFPPELNLRYLAATPPTDELLPEVLDLAGMVLQHLMPVGLAEYRQSLQSAQTWQHFDPVAQKWASIKSIIWTGLTQSERIRIKELRAQDNAAACHLSVGSTVKVSEGKRQGEKLVISSINQDGIWVRMPSSSHACAGPFTPNQVELIKEAAA